WICAGSAAAIWAELRVFDGCAACSCAAGCSPTAGADAGSGASEQATKVNAASARMIGFFMLFPPRLNGWHRFKHNNAQLGQVLKGLFSSMTAKAMNSDRYSGSISGGTEPRGWLI